MDALEKRINAIVTDALETRDVMFGHLADRLLDAGAQVYVDAQFAGIYRYDRDSNGTLAYYWTVLAAVAAMICAAGESYHSDLLMVVPEEAVTVDCTTGGLYAVYRGHCGYGTWTLLKEVLKVDEWFDELDGGLTDLCLDA